MMRMRARVHPMAAHVWVLASFIVVRAHDCVSCWLFPYNITTMHQCACAFASGHGEASETRKPGTRTFTHTRTHTRAHTHTHTLVSPYVHEKRVLFVAINRRESVYDVHMYVYV